MPGAAEVVAVGVSHRDERLDRVDVLRLHLGDRGRRREEGEARQGLHVGVTLQLVGTHTQRRQASTGRDTCVYFLTNIHQLKEGTFSVGGVWRLIFSIVFFPGLEGFFLEVFSAGFFSYHRGHIGQRYHTSTGADSQYTLT